MRIDLRDGMWAELREQPTHGQVNLVRRAILRADDDIESAVEVATAFIAAYVVAWSVKNGEGNEVPPDRAADAPDDIVLEVSRVANGLYTGRPDPKDSAEPSAS